MSIFHPCPRGCGTSIHRGSYCSNCNYAYDPYYDQGSAVEVVETQLSDGTVIVDEYIPTGGRTMIMPGAGYGMGGAVEEVVEEIFDDY